MKYSLIITLSMAAICAFAQTPIRLDNNNIKKISFIEADISSCRPDKEYGNNRANAFSSIDIELNNGELLSIKFEESSEFATYLDFNELCKKAVAQSANSPIGRGQAEDLAQIQYGDITVIEKDDSIQCVKYIGYAIFGQNSYSFSKKLIALKCP
jgi:hypothetical protein